MRIIRPRTNYPHLTLPPVEGVPPMPPMEGLETGEETGEDPVESGYRIWKEGGSPALLAELKRRAEAHSSARRAGHLTSRAER
jgi:hypothetical protein